MNTMNEQAGEVLNFDLDPFCEVCGRVTDHVGEHDDLMSAGMIDYNHGGHVGLVTWRKVVTHELIVAWRG